MYVELHQILHDISKKKVESALNWVHKFATNEEITFSLRARMCELLFQLHRLHIICLLEQGMKMEVMPYIRDNIECLYSGNEGHLRELKRLACCLLWAGRVRTSPYADLLDDQNWGDAATLFNAFASAALGLPKDSHLSVCLCAGYLVQPTLTKYIALRGKIMRSAQSSDLQIPDLGPTLQFHSSFSCPVLQQASTPTNPPMLLPCHHVLSQSAVNSLVKSGGRLKCPYCPSDCAYDQCIVINL
jgi:hypothetical protein